jgi:hypothetical protein
MESGNVGADRMTEFWLGFFCGTAVTLSLLLVIVAIGRVLAQEDEERENR